MSGKWIKGFEPWFLDASSAWARSNGGLEGQQLTDYFRTRLRYVDYGLYQKLSTKLAAETPADPKVAVVDQDTSMALSPLHFVYMDVGCWAGDGEGAWTRHREFGVVHGHVVILCSFSKEPEYYTNKLKTPPWQDLRVNRASTPLIDASILNHPDFPPIGDLLDNLAGAADSLGTLRILGATMVTTRYMPVPGSGPDAPINVFIGDLHAPVATNSNNVHLTDGGRERLLGRLDMGPAVLNVPIPGSPISPKTAWFINEILSNMDFGAFTTRDAVEEWLSYYHQPSGRTADIFQGAGHDLRTFVDYLRNFHESMWPLKVFQLGDFFDLWMGFRRGFKGSMFFKENLVPHAMDFAHFWVERTLFKTEQSSHLTHLLTLSQEAGPNRKNRAALRTHFLYGNHDNYRRFPIEESLTVPAGLEHAGKAIDVFKAPWKYEEPGMWAEHGHQPDTSNHDDDPTFGHKATQAAFIEPGMRNIEGFMTWAISLGDSEDIPRTLSIQHAMKRCLSNRITASEPCRGIYVMGHSHEPMLKRVELWPFPPYKYR
jgi:hypothetical protein